VADGDARESGGLGWPVGGNEFDDRGVADLAGFLDQNLLLGDVRSDDQGPICGSRYSAQSRESSQVVDRPWYPRQRLGTDAVVAAHLSIFLLLAGSDE